MCNTIRKILETYIRFEFNKDSPSNFLNEDLRNKNIDDATRIRVGAIINLLNVNSHVGYENDSELLSYNKDDIIISLKKIFEMIHGSSHFENHWHN